jgi:hypothetical protein
MRFIQDQTRRVFVLFSILERLKLYSTQPPPLTDVHTTDPACAWVFDNTACDSEYVFDVSAFVFSTIMS